MTAFLTLEGHGEMNNSELWIIVEAIPLSDRRLGLEFGLLTAGRVNRWYGMA